jgi:putative transposase
VVNAKRVLRLMQEVGIQAVYPKPRLSQNNAEHKIYPYLLRDLKIVKINQVWQVDITYLKLGTRFVYLVALIDIYSRYLVGWNLSFALDTENCLDAIQKALKIGVPEIVNSDQGCQFTSDAWIAEISAQAIKISMDGKGRCKDNIYIERFWRSIKYEAFYLNDYADFRELYCGVKEYIDFYNNSRPHQNLGYLRPADIYQRGMEPFSRYKDLQIINPRYNNGIVEISAC